MNRTIEKGKTLLVDGPASVKIIVGSAEVFGSTLGSSNKTVIREGKRLPFVVKEKAEFEISLGENAAVEEVEGDTIPPSWGEAYKEMITLEVKPITAMVLGPVDSGKSSFCTYLVNRLLSEKRRVAILDGDIGQSDIGPPCTVAYTLVTRPVTDLFSLRQQDAFFVGTTSPCAVTDKVIEGLTSLKKHIMEKSPDVIIVNSDGWVEGDDALAYKLQLVKNIGPEIVFCIQQKEELAPVSRAVHEYRKFMIEEPATIKQRNLEKRRNLRELGYVKYLKNAKVQSLPMNWVKIEGDELYGLNKLHEDARQSTRMCQLLGMKPLHFAEFRGRISIIIGRTRWISEEKLHKVEDSLKKKVVLIHKGEEEGLLTAVYGPQRKFLGIGVLQEIDFTRKTLKICTPVSDEISIVNIGKVKLDKNMKEVQGLPGENGTSFNRLF